jgi:hypothetical protein
MRLAPERQTHAQKVVLLVPVVHTEITHVEQIADCRHIERHVRIVVRCDRIRKVVSASISHGIEPPVPLDELEDRGMIAIRVPPAELFSPGVPSALTMPRDNRFETC